jgi:hypothetical protein
MHGRMPAEIGYVKADGETRMEQILPVPDFIGFIVYIYYWHTSSPWAPFLPDMLFEIFPEISDGAFQRLHRTGCEGAKGMSWP